MAQREVITEAILQAAMAALDARIASPIAPAEKRYSRREAFLKLRARAKEALAAGHSLETVLDDLKGVGLGLTVSTARQYLKPGRRVGGKRSATRAESLEETLVHRDAKADPLAVVKSGDTNKGTFTVVDDDNEI